MKSSSFPQRLVLLRKQRGLTVSQVARKIGVPESTYRAWEYGRAIQGPDPYLALATTFSVSLEELLAGRPSEKELPERLISQALALLERARRGVHPSDSI